MIEPDERAMMSGVMRSERLGLPLPERCAYHTAARFALDQLGDLPHENESFEAWGWRFEIVDLDGRRIDKLLAWRIPTRAARRRGSRPR